MTTIPEVGQTVKYKGANYRLVSCNMGGKCKIKKLDLPKKGRVLNEIDIKELS